MNVLHLSSEYPPAAVFGLGRYAQELAETQVALGHHVVVVTNSLSGKEHDTVRSGVTVKRVHFPSPPKAPATSAMLLHFNLQIIERVIEEQLSEKRPKFDVINAHDWLTVPAAFHLSRLLNCPFVTTLHDVIFNKAGKRQFTAEDAYVAGVENWACHVSNRVVVLSESVKRETLIYYHAASERVAVVPGGVGIRPLGEDELPALSAWRNKLLPPEEDLLLYAGRLDSEKGVFTLLEALRQVSQARKNGWRLAMAGKGQLQAAVEDALVKLGLQNRVALLGYLDQAELRLAYAAADILVVPSDYEPYGLVALEGQRLGTPVIVSETGGLAETIRRTGGGLFFPPGDANALCQQIQTLLSDIELRKNLGMRGQRNTELLFNWQLFAAQLSTEYELAQKQPQSLDAAVPEWTAPNLRRQSGATPSRSESAQAPVPQTDLVSAHRNQMLELSEIVIFWHKQKMPQLRPVLERLVNAHALEAVNGLLHVVPVNEAERDSTPWAYPLEHARIRYSQPQRISDLWRNTALVLADAEFAESLVFHKILNPQQIPTVWIGPDVPGCGWSASSLDEMFALANKALCDERLRTALAPDVSFSIPQLPWRGEERAKPSVLHILPQLVTGGAETTLLEIVKGCNSVGHSVLCLGPLEGPIPDELRTAGATVTQTHSKSRDEILGLIKQLAPDILHLHSMSYLPHWIPVHRHLAEWNILETEHVVGIGSGHFGACDAVACVSSAARGAHRPYEDAWRDAGPHFTVVYNGINPADFQELPSKGEMRRKLGLPLDRPIIGRVSALARNKLPQEALEAMALTHEKIPEAIFVIVGDGPQLTPAQEWFNQRGLSDFVRFLGERRDVPAVLRAFDVFAYYTTKDALGNVILEAAAAGVPVVTTDVEGTREALSDAPGTLVPLGDIQTFARETAKWAAAKNLHSKYRLPERFSRQAMAQRYAALYENVLGAAPIPAGCSEDEEVTVLIPVFKPQIEWLKEALNSVASQTYPHWKLLIVDDGNDAETVASIRAVIQSNERIAERSRLVSSPQNAGVADALNLGLASCETKLVARLDADDRMHPQRLARQMSFMRRNPDISVVGGFARLIDSKGAVPSNGVNCLAYPTRHDEIVFAFAKFCALAHPAVLYRREHIEKVGGYRRACNHYEDFDLWIRLAEANYRLANLASTLIDYRLHGDSVSKTFQDAQHIGTQECLKRAARLQAKQGRE